MSKFIIKNVGNGLGDCFFIQMEDGGNECIIMIDGQRGGQAESAFVHIKECIRQYRKIDYIVITHIDDDHIGGILKLLELPENDDVSKKLSETVFIYNKVTSSVINYEQAERIETILAGRKVIHTCQREYSKIVDDFLLILSYQKRKKFDPEEYEQYKECPVLTFIHPCEESEVNEVYKDYCKKKQKTPLGKPYAKLVNKYSIVFLLEFLGRCVLFVGDANMQDISPKVMKLKNITGKINGEMPLLEESQGKVIDIIKIPHHGAKDNNKDLEKIAKQIGCSRFIVTGEKIWNEMHPDKSLMEKLYNEYHEKLSVYTTIDMTKYEHYDEVVKNTEEINVLEIKEE